MKGRLQRRTLRGRQMPALCQRLQMQVLLLRKLQLRPPRLRQLKRLLRLRWLSPLRP
jgi:hypothetical protein